MPTAHRSSSQIREQLGHPIIDADGHTVESWPALSGYIRAEGIVLDPEHPLTQLGILPSWRNLSVDERRHQLAYRPAWWAFPARNTDDLATANLPKLMYERLDAMGIDFSIVYPSLGLVFLHLENDEFRRAACRAVNRYHADVFSAYHKRITPVAVVPMHTCAFRRW